MNNEVRTFIKENFKPDTNLYKTLEWRFDLESKKGKKFFISGDEQELTNVIERQKKILNDAGKAFHFKVEIKPNGQVFVFKKRWTQKDESAWRRIDQHIFIVKPIN